MNNKMKYVEEILKLDVSMLNKYFEKLENLMAKYIDKQYTVSVNSISLIDSRIEPLLSQCTLFEFEKDEKFSNIENSFIIASNDNETIDEIRNIVNENQDYYMSSVMVAMAIADVEDISKNE